MNNFNISYPSLLNQYTDDSTFNAIYKPPVFFIAEAGTGHGGDFSVVKQMVDECAANQVAAIKFQHVIAREILHPLCGKVSLSSGDKDLFEYFQEIEKKADIHFWSKVKKYCEQKGVLFLCSFFGSKSFADLQSLGVKAYKIASPEMNYYQLWNHLRNCSEPVFFSSGVAKQSDLEHLFSYFKTTNYDKSRLIHLHCVTAYPAPIESYNLLYTKVFEKQFGVLTGLSDHSNHGFLVPLVFSAFKAIHKLPVVIEKHFSLTSLKNNIDDPVAINETELKKLIPAINEVYDKFFDFVYKNEVGMNHFIIELVEVLLKIWIREKWDNVFKDGKELNSKNFFNLVSSLFGNGVKSLFPSEEIDYPTTKRSLLAIMDIATGEEINHQNASYLRSEKNLSPGINFLFEEKAWGAIARTEIKNGEGITEDKIIFSC